MKTFLPRFALVLFCTVVMVPAQDAPKKSRPVAVPSAGAANLRIVVTSVPVIDQDKALKFYAEKLGFVKKTDIPLGEHRWLTVVSAEQPDGTELLLEPTAFAPAKTYQKALFDAGIPCASFAVADIATACERMKKLGVVFRSPPTKRGPVTLAVLEDTCGNLIQLVQK